MTARMRKKLQHRLMVSVMFGDARHVANALRSGADPNLPDRDRSTPLYQASVAGRADVVRMLVRAGADPNVESGVGAEGLPLCAAACWGHTDAVRELLTAGADPKAREDHGKGHTAAEWATRGGWHETLTALQAGGGGIEAAEHRPLRAGHHQGLVGAHPLPDSQAALDRLDDLRS